MVYESIGLSNLIGIIGIIIGVVAIGLTIYGLDKEKRTNFFKAVNKFVLLLSIGMNFHNIYSFFVEELTRKSIFLLVVSVAILIFFLIIYIILEVLKIQRKQSDHTSRLIELFEEKSENQNMVEVVLIRLCGIIEKANKDRFYNHYDEDINKINELIDDRIKKMDYK